MRLSVLIALLVLPAFAQDPVPCAARGSVTEEGTNKPVERARVSITTGTYSLLRLTDTQGNFCFQHLIPADYHLAVEKPGYLELHHPVTLAVESDGPLKPLSLRITRYGRVSGTVLDADGEPVPGASVTIWQRTRNGPNSVDDATADGSGAFHISQLAPGTYYLSAKIDNPMERPYILPFAGVQGQVVREKEVETFYSAALSFADAAPVQVKAGESKDLVLPLRKVRLRRVTGRVLDFPHAAFLNYRAETETGSDREGSIPIAKDGSFAKVDLPPAKYAFLLGFGQKVIARKDADLNVGDALNITLDPIETVDIPVVVRTEGKGPAFRPHSGGGELILRAEGSDGGAMLEPSGDGAYQFSSVVRGTYRVELWGKKALYLKSVTYVGEAQTRDKIDLRTDRPGGLEITLSSHVAEVQGKVELSEAGADGLTVILADGKGVVQQVGTDQKGRFRMPSVAPGKYRLYAIEGFDEDEWGSPELSKALEEDSLELEVKENEKKQVSVTAISADEWAAALKKAGQAPY